MNTICLSKANTMGMVRRKMGEDIYLTSLKENAYKKEIATL